jgi:hypothetical protein
MAEKVVEVLFGTSNAATKVRAKNFLSHGLEPSDRAKSFS